MPVGREEPKIYPMIAPRRAVIVSLGKLEASKNLGEVDLI
jgi:hypothetical protein